MESVVSSFGVLVVVECQILSSIACPGVLPRSDSFNDNDFSFGEPPWRSTKLHINNGAASSLGEKVIRRSSLWWLLWSCWGHVTERWCLAQRCFAIFSVLSCRSFRGLYFHLYDMNETRITMQKKKIRCAVEPNTTHQWIIQGIVAIFRKKTYYDHTKNRVCVMSKKRNRVCARRTVRNLRIKIRLKEAQK